MQNEENQQVELENNQESVEETATETVAEDTTDYKAEALKWKAIAERNKKKVVKSINQEETPREQIKPADILRSPEFSLHRQGYTEDEIDIIMRNGGPELLKNENSPIVMGLRAARVQRQAEDAASRAQDTSGMSEAERKYSKADLEKMSPQEIEKVLGFAN